MLNDIKSLTWSQTLGVFFGFLGAISPGFLLLFLFKPDLISSLETIKVIIFSLALCLPVVCVNMFVIFQFSDGLDDEFEAGLMSLFLSSVALYPAILISYLFHFSFIFFLLTLVAIQLILSISVIAYEKNKKSEPKS